MGEELEVRARGLYIHVPFCVKKCAYCDFYSLPGRLDSIDDYVRAVLAEARQYPGMAFRTLYLGGGTPSLLGPAGITDLLDGLHPVFDLSGLSEATLEANPDSISGPLLEAAQVAGINRMSIGVQSLSDAGLERVGRIHNAAQAVESIDLARYYGFLNISCDVILGLPGQDWPNLMVTLETLAALDIQHLSLYCLSLEPHTPLGQAPPPDLPSGDEQAGLYENACRLLERRGFVHYEISNFALPGFECRHNLNYWRGGEYLGLGPAAASHLEGRRFKDRPDLDAYLGSPAGQVEEVECLDSGPKAAEEAVLRLRLLAEGLDFAALAARFGPQNIADLKRRLESLAARELLVRDGFCYRLPEKYALVSNPILADVLGE